MEIHALNGTVYVSTLSWGRGGKLAYSQLRRRRAEVEGNKAKFHVLRYAAILPQNLLVNPFTSYLENFPSPKCWHWIAVLTHFHQDYSHPWKSQSIESENVWCFILAFSLDAMYI